MNKMTPEEAAQKVLDHIELHPEKHDQQAWANTSNACGTTGCIAGWTVMLCHDWKVASNSGIGLKGPHEEYVTHQEIVEVAGETYGLDYGDAKMLFSLNEKETAREALRYIANGKQIDWDKISKEYNTSRMNISHW